MTAARPVLSIYYTHKPGGLCRRLYRLLNAAAARGSPVYYLTLDAPPAGSLDSRVTVLPIRFPLRARSGTVFWIAFTLWLPIAATAAARNIRPATLIAFGAYYARALQLARRLYGGEVVLFIRSLVFRNNRINRKPAVLCAFSDLLERRGIRGADRLICMTESMRRDIAEFVRAPDLAAELLPNDVPPPQWKLAIPSPMALAVVQRLATRTPRPFTALTSGVLDGRKNIALLLKCWAALGESEEIELIVAGDGPLRGALERDAAERGVRRVNFIGWVDSLEPLYPAMSIVIHPSLHEGMSNSILEGWGAGLPVLCADTAESRDLMHYPDLLFNPAQPEALAARLSRLAADRTEYDRILALSAERRARYTFDWDLRALELAGIRGETPRD